MQLLASDGTLLTTLLNVPGAGTNHAPAWTSLDAAVPAEAQGRQVSIQLAATDAADPSRVEAGVDDVRVTTP